MSVDSYVREKQEINFFIGGSIIMDSHIFCSKDVNWRTGAVWIFCELFV